MKRPAAPAAHSRFFESPWIVAALLVLAAVLAYQQAWQAGYIWDDDIYVTQNQLLTAPDGLWRIWFSLDSPSQYFPLVYSTFRLEYALWGLHPAGYHIVNILLHAANALLVWQLLRRLRVPGALLAAAIFALHPVHVESVAWITERKNVLMGLFFLLALLAWERFSAPEAGKGRWRMYAAALGCYLLALCSKTTACTLPAALLLILWLRHQRITVRRWLEVVPFVLLGIAMGLVTIWWERHHQGTQGELFAIPWIERVLIANRALWFYLGKLAWPADLAFSYPRWSITASDPAAYMWVFMTLAAAVGIFFARRRCGRGLEVGALFFVASLSPMLGLIMVYTFRYSFVADHYQYLASIGPIALGAAAIDLGLRRLPQRFRVLLGSGVCAALLLTLGALTWRQGAIYRDEETLWRATIETNPASWMALNNLAIHRLHHERAEEAISLFKQAIVLNPGYAEAHYNLGNGLQRLERLDEARAQYEKALSFYPGYVAAHRNLATLLLRQGETANAEAHLRQAATLAPGDPEVQLQLGKALVESRQPEEALPYLRRAVALAPRAGGAADALVKALLAARRSEEAVAFLEAAVQRDPRDAGAENNLGNLLGELGRHEEAAAHLQSALQLKPEQAEAHYNLANALRGLRRMESAIGEYREAVRLKPDYLAARNNLANALLETGRAAEAVTEYEKALELKPDYAAAHRNLGSALRQLGRLDEALAHLQRAWEIDSQTRP